jgi:hypothetical protein
MIATANSRDRGVNELSTALKRRFNFVTIPIVTNKKLGEGDRPLPHARADGPATRSRIETSRRPCSTSSSRPSPTCARPWPARAQRRGSASSPRCRPPSRSALLEDALLHSQLLRRADDAQGRHPGPLARSARSSAASPRTCRSSTSSGTAGAGAGEEGGARKRKKGEGEDRRTRRRHQQAAAPSGTRSSAGGKQALSSFK